MNMKRASKFVWGELDKPRFEFELPQNALEPVIKTDKVSMPDDDIWDNLVFEWIEE